MAIVSEEWRPVVGFEGYYDVSNLGRVRSVSRVGIRRDGSRNPIKGRILSTPVSNHGYQVATLSADCRRATFCVHVLVAAAFIGPRPDGHDVDHVDFNTQNNCADNLEYKTPAGNVAHTHAAGRTPHGETHYAAQITEGQVREAFRLLDSGSSRVQAARSVGIPLHQLNNVYYGQSWKHLGLARKARTPRAG